VLSGVVSGALTNRFADSRPFKKPLVVRVSGLIAQGSIARIEAHRLLRFVGRFSARNCLVWVEPVSSEAKGITEIINVGVVVGDESS